MFCTKLHRCFFVCFCWFIERGRRISWFVWEICVFLSYYIESTGFFSKNRGLRCCWKISKLMELEGKSWYYPIQNPCTLCSVKEIKPSSLRYGYFNHPCDTPSPTSWFVTSVIRNSPVDANSTNSLPQRSNIEKKLQCFPSRLRVLRLWPRFVGWETFCFFKKICSQTVMFIWNTVMNWAPLVERMNYQLQQITKNWQRPLHLSLRNQELLQHTQISRCRAGWTRVLEFVLQYVAIPWKSMMGRWNFVLKWYLFMGPFVHFGGG